MNDKKLSLFGLTLYERVYKENLLINTNIKFSDVKYPGLLYLSYINPIKFQSLEVFTRNDYEKIAKETILLTFHQIFRSNQVDVYELEYKDTVLGKFQWEDSYCFFINSKTVNSPDDFMSELILKSLTTNNNGQSKLPLSFMIDKILNFLIGEKKYVDPAKEFLMRLFKDYGKLLPWVDKKTEGKFLNFVQISQISIDSSKLDDLKKEYLKVNKDLAELYQKNHSYAKMIKDLQFSIDSQFNSRLEEIDP